MYNRNIAPLDSRGVLFEDIVSLMMGEEMKRQERLFEYGEEDSEDELLKGRYRAEDHEFGEEDLVDPYHEYAEDPYGDDDSISVTFSDLFGPT